MVLGGALVAVVLAASAVDEHSGRGTTWGASLPYPKAQACMDAIAVRYGARFGWGGYWQARQTTERSRVALRVNPLTPDSRRLGM